MARPQQHRCSRRPQPQRRSARLRARAAHRVLPEDTESIVAQAREAYERARPFPFTRLPGELRNLVYEFLVADQNEPSSSSSDGAGGGGGGGGPQVFHAAVVALPGVARAGRALRAEYLAVFFRRRVFEVHVYCDLDAWRTLHRVALVASFLGSLSPAVLALPYAAVRLAQARYYGCTKVAAGEAPLRRLWAEVNAPCPGDGPATLARKAACAAAGPRLANLLLCVGVFDEPTTGALSPTPAAQNLWTATLSREPVTGKLWLDHHGKPTAPKYENGVFVKLAKNAHRTAMGIIHAQDGTFQGWSEQDIVEICSSFRFWHNHRCPKEFADEYGEGIDDDDDD